MISPLADVHSINIGKETNIWQFCVVLSNAVIGNYCNINCNVFIENDVTIGDYVTIKSGVQVWDGVRISDYVFLGPNVTFTNDKTPRSKQYPETFLQTFLEQGASIGANSTILAGITIGKYALIGAGSVVTKSVPEYTVWYGNPAIQKGYITKDGNILNMRLIDKKGRLFKLVENQPSPL